MKQPTTKPAPTSAQLAFLHALQSALQAAIISICVAGGQYLVTGNINASGLLTVLISAFAGAGSMVYKSIASNPSLVQAVRDTVSELLADAARVTPNWLVQDVQSAQKIAPKPIVLPQSPPAQQSGGGGMPPDYYSRYRQSLPDMATQGYVPAIQNNPNSMFYNPQQNFPPPALPQSQQGG